MLFRLPIMTPHLAVRGMAGIVCLVGLLCGGKSAQASCGDYVILKGSAAMPSAHQKASDPAPQKVPCNSPICRGEVPPVQVPPSPLSESSTEKPLALFVLALELDGNSPRHDWPALCEHACPGYRSPLERPPSL